MVMAEIKMKIQLGGLEIETKFEKEYNNTEAMMNKIIKMIKEMRV